MLLYNGLHATFDYRIAHWFYLRRCFFIARAISQWSKMWTGIEIHPGATIGRRLVIDHGTGIVIAREFAISGLRMVAASNGTVIAAGWSGKIKTSCTMVGLIAMMVLPNLPTLDLVVNIVILVTTVYSGVEYFCKNWACLGLAKKA